MQAERFTRGAAMSDNTRAEPVATRLSLPPQYGIRGPTEGAGLLPWTRAIERLTSARGYWLATVRPDGRPHVTVVWGVWLHNAFYFGTIPRSRKARNLMAQ